MPILPCYRACAEVRSTHNDGDVHQLRRGAVSHRLPAVRAHRARPHLEAGTIQIARFRVLDRSTRLEVYVRRPCDLCAGVGRDEATVCSVLDVEKAVLRGSHKDLADTVGYETYGK